MTYLGFPRLHFSGHFQADPSTVNNDPHHFDIAAFQPDWDEPGQGPTKGWWNPQGTGAWRFRDCAVRSVYYADGTYCDDPGTDAVVGRALNSASTRVAGKLVDLDPEQQMVSQIWGFQVLVGEPGGPTGFRSDFEVAAFADIWVRYPQGQPDSFFGAVYQSVLTSVDWADQLDSRFLSELGRPEQLSIKFVVDGYDDDGTSPTFTFGRVSGTIGPYVEGEPHHFVAGRRLRATTSSPLNFAVCRLDDQARLSVDLGNSLPTTSPGGAIADVGPLQLALLPPGAPPVPIGPIHYRATGWYEDRAGIETFTLTAEQASMAAATPLGIYADGEGGPNVMLGEDASGTYVFADDYVFRLDPSVPAPTTLWALSFGRPASGQQIDLSVDNSAMQGQVLQGLVPGPPVGIPADVVTEATRGKFPLSVDTGEDGTVEIQLVGSDPGNPRGYIDGQVYGIRYDWHGVDVSAYQPEPMNLLSVLVWNAYEVDGKPTWIDHVRPIFHAYADLYPVMRRVLDLDDFDSVRRNLVSLQYVFALPPTDPNYMPVVRDLATAKRTMIQAWLREPLYMRVATVADLQRALQQAIELEHATIPTYLTSLFSIKDGRNREVAGIIQSVVVEEMLHMALACNLLNAIGGSPNIDTAGFVPRYPSTLPGGIRPDLVVSLRKASIEHVRDVFMGIEEPEATIDPAETHELTIGWFYEEIVRGLEQLDQQLPNLFSGDPARQAVGWRGPGELFAVNDLASAKRAIREIRDQGEGTSKTDPLEGGDGELAHFYKFEEIVRGRRLVVHEGGYDFSGAEIPFDPDGVWPMVDDPSTDALPPGSLVRAMSAAFDEQYGALLGVLHQAFNGSPELLDSAIELMFSLEVAAKGLVRTPIESRSTETAGPAFQYPGRPGSDGEAEASPTARFKPLTTKGQPAPRLTFAQD